MSSHLRDASLEDQSLLVGMSAFLVFTSSMVSLAFDIERSCLASQRLDDDLHCHHTIGPVCCVRVPCSTSYSASCVQNAPSIFWHASWSSPSPPCTAHLPLNAGWMPLSSTHILPESTMCLLRQSGAPQRVTALAAVTPGVTGHVNHLVLVEHRGHKHFFSEQRLAELHLVCDAPAVNH